MTPWSQSRRDLNMPSLPEFCHRVIVAGSLFLILFAPLCFGAVEPWAEATLEATILGIFIAWIITLKLKGRHPLRILPFSPAFFFLVVLGGFQLIPLPAVLRSFLVSSDPTRTSGAVPHWLPLSCDWRATLSASLLLLAFLVFSLVLSNHMTTPGRTKLLLYALITVGSFEALYGLIEFATGHHHVFWYRKIYYLEEVTGTYVNHNHFAGLMGMILPLSIGMFILRLRKYTGAHDIGGSARQAGRIPLGLISLSGSIILILLALILSKSRGAMLASGFSLVYLLYVLVKGESGDGQKKVGVVLGLSIAIVLLVFSQPLINRFSYSVRDAPERLELWKDSLSIIGDFPWLGTGLGTYARMIPRYRSHPDVFVVSGIPQPAAIHFAHNDYLQLVTESGVAGLGLLIWAIWKTSGNIYKKLRHIDQWENRLLGHSLIAGMVALLAHNLVDFNFHVPANALVFCVLLCLAYTTMACAENSKTVPSPLRCDVGMGR